MFKEMFKLIRGGARPSLDILLAGADSHLNNFGTLLPPAPTSKPRTPFESGLPKEQISLMNLSGPQRARVARRMGPLLWNVYLGARMYSGRVRPTQNQISPEVLGELERLARKLGAKDIAYVQVPGDAIFLDKGIPHRYAIVFTVEMDREKISTAPSLECQLEVMDGYLDLAVISRHLSAFLHRRGFAAYPGTALGGITDYPLLAELAGLGTIGYHGLLITPGEGARLRINTIYTNITNLPRAESNDHLWVRDFCSLCRKCVRSCPPSAIFQEPQPRGNSGMQCIDHTACRDYFTSNFGCAVCIKVCPFSQAGYDKVKANFKGNPDAPQFRIAPGDASP
jgi:epoxyqueuosine reductase